MKLVQVLRGIIFFTAVVSLAAVSAEEERLTPDEELGVVNNTEEVEEVEKPSFDDAVDIQEG